MAESAERSAAEKEKSSSEIAQASQELEEEAARLAEDPQSGPEDMEEAQKVAQDSREFSEELSDSASKDRNAASDFSQMGNEQANNAQGMETLNNSNDGGGGGGEAAPGAAPTSPAAPGATGTPNAPVAAAEGLTAETTSPNVLGAGSPAAAPANPSTVQLARNSLNPVPASPSAVGLSEAATPSQMHSYRLVSLSPANGNISGALRGQSSGTKFTGASLERSSLESNAESLREKLQRRLDGALSGKREENSPSPTMPVATALESSGGPALRALVTSQPDSSVSSGSQGLPQSDGDLAPFSANLGPPKMAMAGSETDEAVRRLMGIIAPEANAAETGALRGAEDGVDVTLFERTHLAYRNSLRLGRVRVKGSP